MVFTERRSRPDRATANTVLVILILAEQDGRPAAAALMDQAAVPFHVIGRVLSEPAVQRRPIIVGTLEPASSRIHLVRWLNA